MDWIDAEEQKNSKKNSIIEWEESRMRDTNNYFDAQRKKRNSKKFADFQSFNSKTPKGSSINDVT